MKTSVETYGGKTNPNVHPDGAEAAVNPLTSTLLVLIKTRCGENDCREERNTSQTHMHAHTHAHTNSPRSDGIQKTTTDCDIRGVDTCRNKKWRMTN